MSFNEADLHRFDVKDTTGPAMGRPAADRELQRSEPTERTSPDLKRICITVS